VPNSNGKAAIALFTKAVARKLRTVGPAPDKIAFSAGVHTPPNKPCPNAKTGKDLGQLTVVSKHITYEAGI